MLSVCVSSWTDRPRFFQTPNSWTISWTSSLTTPPPSHSQGLGLAQLELVPVCAGLMRSALVMLSVGLAACFVLYFSKPQTFSLNSSGGPKAARDIKCMSSCKIGNHIKFASHRNVKLKCLFNSITSHTWAVTLQRGIYSRQSFVKPSIIVSLPIVFDVKSQVYTLRFVWVALVLGKWQTHINRSLHKLWELQMWKN